MTAAVWISVGEGRMVQVRLIAWGIRCGEEGLLGVNTHLANFTCCCRVFHNSPVNWKKVQMLQLKQDKCQHNSKNTKSNGCITQMYKCKGCLNKNATLAFRKVCST